MATKDPQNISLTKTKIEVKKMNGHTAASEIPGRIKPMVESAEASNDAIEDPKRKKRNHG